MKFQRSRLLLLPTALVVPGCRAGDHSPTLDVLGSYFPAWAVCITVGLGLTLITRQIFIGLKLNPHLRPIQLVYLCLMIFFTLATWLLLFKN